MSTYNAKVRRKQGGNVLQIASGGSIVADSGSTVTLAGSVNIGGVSRAASISFSPAAGAANICEVTITVLDGAGAAIARPFHLDITLSDAASGAGLTAVTASGTVTNKTASGIVVDTYTAKKALRVQTLATGVFVLEITDTAKTAFYVTATLGGNMSVSAQLVTGNYG